MIAAALEPIPRASGISLSIVSRNAGSDRFRCDATLFATRRIRLSGVVGINVVSTPRGMISKLRVSNSTVTRRYLSRARLRASKPAPRLDVLAGTRNEQLRLMTILTSLRRFLRGRDDPSRFQIGGPPVPET